VRRFIGMLVVVLVLFGMTSPASAGQILSHVYSAARNYESMPEPLKSVVKESLDAYMAGAQGPDVVGLSSIAQSWAIRRDFGREAHYEKTGMLALFLLTRADTRQEFAYAVGWITHYLNDIHVHPVVNSYGGLFLAGSAGERRHKALEMLENKHIFADPSFYGVVAPYDLAQMPPYIDKATVYFIYEAFRDLFHGAYDEADARTNFGFYITLTENHVRAASRNFLSAHANQTGKFTADESSAVGLAFPRMPSEEEYRLIMEGPLTVSRVRAEKDKVIVSLKVNDTRLFGRFVKDWEKEIKIASAGYQSALEDINVFYQETLGAGKPYKIGQSTSPAAMQAVQRLRQNVLKDISLDDTPHPRFGSSHPWPGEIKDLNALWYQGTLSISTEQGNKDVRLDSSIPLQIRNPREGFEKSRSGEAEIELPVHNPDNDSFGMKLRLFALDPHNVGRPPLYLKYDYVDITADYITDKKKDDKTEVKPPPTPPDIPMKLSYCLPGNWEGGLDRDGVLVLNRKAAKIKGPCGWDSSVTGKLTAKYHPGFSKDDPKTPAEARERAEKTFKARRQGDTPNDMAVGLFMGGGIEGVSSISMGDFDGSLADFAIWIRRGSGGMFGYNGSYMGANGRGQTVKAGTGYVEFSYNAWGGGCWDNSDRAYLVTQCAAAQQEAKAILACIRVTPDSKVTATPYEGPKYDGSDLPKVKLVPSKKGKIRIGESITVQAVVENDKPEDSPFAYNWGGTFDGKPEDLKKVGSVTIRPSKPGKFEISVSVDGARFGLGSDTYAYEVADLKAKVERVPAGNTPVPVGTKTGFKVTLTSDGQPVAGNFVFRWQPHPEIPFSRLDAAEPDVTATFPKPGRVKVWVQVLEKRDGTLATLTESEQVEIEVIKPTLSVSVSPTDAFVGQEVKARVAARPDLKEIEYRWMPLPANTKLLSESQDKREISFYAKDDQPIEVKAQATLSGSGDDLGEARGSFRAKKYGVSVTGPRLTGPKPKIWKEGAGLVEVDNAFAVDQELEFAAHLNPDQEDIHYVWSVASGACKVLKPLSRTTQVVANQAGTCQVAVLVKDKNDVTLGRSGSTFTAAITRETIAAGQKKAKDVADAKTKVSDAKTKARKGDYDGAIKDAEEAGKLDPANKDAAGMADKLRKEKETIHQQIDKAKKPMDENKFADAQKELIVASNLNSYYPPVQQANQELGTRWNKYNSEVRDKVYEVRSANEKKDFGKALEIAAAWRASTKLDPNADEQLKQQENWAKQWKAQKDRQIETLKAAGEKVKNYDYSGALKTYDEGFANGQNIYNGSEPEYKEAVELRRQAFTKNKRLNELIPWVRKAAEDKDYMTVDALQNTLKTADEAIALQPSNEELKKWREQIVARTEKTKADNDRTAAGRKYLDTARSEENTYLSQVSYVQSKSGQWGENVEVDMQSHIQKAIDNYRESLKYIPDAAVEKKIKELEATLEGRKKYLENYRLSVTLKNEADALYRQATQDPDIQSASPKYDEAAEKYRKSLSLYRPFNAENVEKTIYVLETYKHERWVKKYWADGQALEKEGKIVEAIAAYDKALAAYHPTVPQSDRMWIQVHIQDLRNRINGAKTWRADGEAKQKAGKIAEAIASYKQSLALLPDAALAEHVRMLEGKLAEAGEKKAAADKLWQEGTALFNQGRPSDALTKFKESLGYWSDASRQKYVADMEARRAKAIALRDEGAKLQQGNRIPEAIAKYKESLTYWPDTGLSSHIATLEGKLKQDADSAARKAKAKQLRDEGYALQQKNQLQAAVGKYKESLAILPDKQLGDYIRQLEAKLTAASMPTSSTSAATSQVASSGFYLVDLQPYGGKKGSARKVNNIDVDDGSWIRLKATHEKRLRLDMSLPQQVPASAVAIVSNLDNAHNVPDKMTTTVLTVHTTSGDRTFEFKAGVHSSEWNRSETGGAEHKWPKDTYIGDKRWMAVFNLPSGSVVTGLRFDHRDTDKKYYHGDAAPGFCLRGISLVRSGGAVAELTAAKTAASTATINIVGRWKSEAMEGGKVNDVSYTTFNRDGSYNMDVSGEELAGVAVCTVRGGYTLSGQTLTLKPSGSQCKFSDGTTRSAPVDKYDTISGRVSGNDRSFTYLPGGNVSVRYTRQ
jgi:tetratricopeptide (TPR) repeat protein